MLPHRRGAPARVAPETCENSLPGLTRDYAATGIWDLRPERFEDHDAIRVVHERAFDPSPAEAKLVDLLRDSDVHVPELCLVAAAGDGQLAGHIMFSRARLARGPQVLALAPMAVLPEHQRQGVGSALVEDALRRAAETSFPLVVVVGHADYYPRFGFEPAGALGIEAPFEVPPEAFMAYRLPAYTPTARGPLIYAEAFAEVS
jgi:putative acetyltransferase